MIERRASHTCAHTQAKELNYVIRAYYSWMSCLLRYSSYFIWCCYCRYSFLALHSLQLSQPFTHNCGALNSHIHTTTYDYAVWYNLSAIFFFSCGFIPCYYYYCFFLLTLCIYYKLYVVVVVCVSECIQHLIEEEFNVGE